MTVKSAKTKKTEMAMNKSFWDEQARRYKGSVRTVNFDPLMEELEYLYLKKFLQKGKKVCDLGCGNGITLLKLASLFPESTFYGLDYSEEMIRAANEKNRASGLKNVHFLVADATDRAVRNIFDFRFDIVIAKRLLINLKGQRKMKAVRNIHSLMKKGGTYCMVECFIEPLRRINRIRKKLGLEEIKVKPFNEYLTAGFVDRAKKGLFEIDEEVDFGSLYYFTSRIYNACLSKGAPDYFSPINRLAVEITQRKGEDTIVRGYSPEKMVILRKG